MTTQEFHALIQAATCVTQKRDALCRNAPICPKCGNVQVQLVDWTQPGKAGWKCRTDCGCGHWWVVDVADDPMMDQITIK